MGQKTSPIGFRTGVTLGWQSTWFAPKANYGDFLVEDQKIRDYIDRRFNRQMPKGAVAKVEIIRTRNEVNVTLHSGRPGVVIGPRGGEVDKLREELEGLTGRKVTVNVIEIKEPDLNAALVAEAIAEQLGKRASFRRTMKQFCEAAMNAGAKGVKITCAGRLAGSEMARTETQKMGSIPLHTLDADVDYAQATARTTYGAIGIKVWIYRGKFGEVLEPSESRRRRPPQRMGPGGGRPESRSGSGGQPSDVSQSDSAPAPQMEGQS
ncbi:MAG TPA: 30S ribosomal protein S3 [Sedimentisphaerales bacterium]|nr:30S ribosomal protein S3 [Sedimentisphaerales bacterium]HOV76627.1 30S ribosomal protein S3 [Sedimentisphaerales bacterium]HQI27289.1 30S ribosomal protein S3 [Sedimentisphaerales bacterium]